MASENSKQFWKRNAKLPGSIQPVYGAQHPPLDPRLTKNFIKERSKVNTVPLKKYVEEDVENFDVTNLSQDMLRSIEADSFWCMSKLLDGIQDNYTFAQPGIQKKVKALEELVSRIDEQTYLKRWIKNALD